jgi:hypothetical protein
MTTQSTLGASGYDDALLVCCPRTFSDTVRQAARNQYIGASAYIRHVLRQLKIDGCCPSSSEDAGQ